MSIVRGTVETYRGAAEGFLGDDGGNGGEPGGGVTGVYGDATVYPSLTVVDGSITAATTHPRAVGASGTYGATFTHPVVTTVNGAVTVGSSVRNSVSSVCWTSSASSVPAGGVSPSFSTVAYDSLDIITETVAGSAGMTLTATGLYLLTFVGQAAASQTIRLYANGVQVPGAFQVNPSSGLNLSVCYPFAAGTNVYFACSVAATYSAVFRAVTVMRLQ